MAAAAVFISYSSRDESFALDLKDELPEHEVWIDSEGIPHPAPDAKSPCWKRGQADVALCGNGDQ